MNENNMSIQNTRIAYISNSTIPSQTANSIHVMKMCDAFQENGHTVILIGSKGETEITDIHEWYNCKTKFPLKLYAPASSALAKASQKIKKAINKFVRNADLIYTRDVIAGLLASIILRKRTIIELHQPLPTGKLQETIITYLLLRKRIKIIVISQALKDIITKQRPALSKQIKVFHDGADEILSSALVTSKNRPIVSYIGSTYKGRGLELIFDLATRLPAIDFHIIGGPESEYTENSHRPATPPGNLIYHGHKQQKYAIDFMQKSSILLAPYQNKVHLTKGKGETSTWMSPLKIFEYMASGTPFIASDLPVLHEILTHYENCLLCPPEDLHAWQAAITELLDNQHLGRSIANTAANQIKEKYSWRKRAEGVIR